jgi:hypothetical protein
MAVPLPAPPEGVEGGGILQALPQPRDLPGSLFKPPQPRTLAPMPMDGPYFVRDPLLDDGRFPSAGWFGGAEIQVVKPTLINDLKGFVQNRVQRANGTSSTVALPSAPLDWTVAPRFFVGYRLPSGFGEFAVAYRYLGTAGRAGVLGADGPATLNSRLAFNMIDLDYSSRELNLGHTWDMKWTFGFRILTMFFDSQSDQSLAQAAAGSGIFQKREYDKFPGLGPHAALELTHHLWDSGWALWFRSDFSTDFDFINEGFFTRSTMLGPTGRPLAGESFQFGHQATPIINVQAGVTWKPSRTSATRFFMGYQFERFWALSTLLNGGSQNGSVGGQLWDQGVVMQATINY